MSVEPRKRSGWSVTRARHLVGQAALGVLGLQAATAAGVTLAGSLRRRKRRPHRFPISDPRPQTVGTDTVTIYTFGEDLYADMLATIDAATSTVRLETFIWKDDEVGQQFKDAVVRASERGVRVHLIIDEFANLVVPRSFFKFPEPIKVRLHPAVASLAIRPRNGGRDHRKLLIVDGDVAFLGGYNIGSLYADRWRDTHARFSGPVVADIDNAFVDQWNTRPLGLRRRVRRMPELGDPDRAANWSASIRILRNSPRMAVYPIRNMYLEAIDRAAHHILLTQAYFVPDDDFIAALFAAVRRGVEVQLIIPAESNHVLADWLSRGFYDELLRDGVRIFLYQGAMVHAKTGTIDGIWSTIGTANLDRLSLLGNYEINAEITDADVAARMEEIFAIDLANCVELTLGEWRARSVVAKATEAFLSPWRPLA